MISAVLHAYYFDIGGDGDGDVMIVMIIVVVMMMIVMVVMDLWMQIELDPDLEDHHVGFKLPASQIEKVF